MGVEPAGKAGVFLPCPLYVFLSILVKIHFLEKQFARSTLHLQSAANLEVPKMTSNIQVSQFRLCAQTGSKYLVFPWTQLFNTNVMTVT